MPAASRSWWRDAGVSLGLVAICGAVIGAAQAPAATVVADVKETSDDVFLLPPPSQLEAMSLGYRSALADVMWANVLVSQGLRLTEKRRYANVVPAIESITALDPKFRDPYLMADPLVNYQRVRAPQEDVRAVRRIMEAGTKARPLDADIWLQLGEYVSFTAGVSYIEDPDERERWRLEGLPYLERAVELAGTDSNIAWLALGGASAYRRAGQRDAAIRFYQKVLATTDDDDLKRDVQPKLDALLDQEATEGASDRAEAKNEALSKQLDRARRIAGLQPLYSELRRTSFTGLPRSAMVVLGPPRDPADCAGGARSPNATTKKCARSFRDWAEKQLEDSGPSASVDPANAQAP